MPLDFQAVSPVIFPEMQDVIKRLLGSIPQPASFESILQQGISSPLLQAVLQPALANLIPGEAVARRNLTDQFRSAGALRSGAYGTAVPRLEGELQGSRGNLISQVLGQVLGTLISGQLQGQRNAFQGPELLSNLAGTLRPAVGFGRSEGGGGEGGIGFSPTIAAPSARQPSASSGRDLISQLLQGGSGYPPGANYDTIVAAQYADYLKSLGLAPGDYDPVANAPISQGGDQGTEGMFFDPITEFYNNLGFGTQEF